MYLCVYVRIETILQKDAQPLLYEIADANIKELTSANQVLVGLFIRNCIVILRNPVQCEDMNHVMYSCVGMAGNSYLFSIVSWS